ncbi:MAG: histidine kinase [Microbacterium sp.]
MTTPARVEATARARAARRLSRGIAATWWYTCAGILFFWLALLAFWVTALAGAGRGVAAVVVVGIGGLVWMLATTPLLLQYRNRPDAAPAVRSRSALVALAVAVAFGVLSGLVAGAWLLAAFPVVEVLVLLNWGPGIRLRVVLAVTVVLVAVWAIDARFTVAPETALNGALVGFYSTMLPAMTVLSLWWWDVLVALDRARASEARLAATQERLRVATDVHDLQGHHLQVIALQLELAERLLTQDAEAAAAQLRAARASVDEAQQGTRDLATRFRTAALGDEIANAADLLRAAGADVETAVASEADLAPASVFGPVIRETTTNVLRHGGGRRARLALSHTRGAWRFEISNDAEPAGPATSGSGLEGIAHRVAEAGGTLDVSREGQLFTVVVTVPAQIAEAG